MRILFLSCIVFSFLIQPQPVSQKSTITIAAVGDVYVSQRIIDQHADELHKLNLQGDIVFANFEGVLSNHHSRQDALRLKLTMPLESINILEQIGINTLSLANNHVLDSGTVYYSNTLSVLNCRGFHTAGLADQGAAIDINGQTVRFIAFSFSGDNNINKINEAAEIIGSFKEDIIIVSAHMGGEHHRGYLVPHTMEFFGNEERGDAVAFSRACIDAGADLILGHGPHILRGIELYKNRLIVYSLGNFIFDYPGVERHGDTPTFSIHVDVNRTGDFQKARITSYTFRYGVPIVDASNRVYNLIKHLSQTNLQNKNILFAGEGMIYSKGRTQ
ncbi:MAG TPA: hypothetical protein DCO77_04165 [Nitrospiraceae bacterium]|nr:hypothetical protein [Nitrospiraceae bacterium]